MKGVIILISDKTDPSKAEIIASRMKDNPVIVIDEKTSAKMLCNDLAKKGHPISEKMADQILNDARKSNITIHKPKELCKMFDARLEPKLKK